MDSLKVAAGIALSLGISVTLAGDFGERAVYPSVKLAQVVRSGAEYDGKNVRISGKIADVCKKKGCWLVVTDGKNKMRVKFKDYAFFVPLGSAGREVTLEGVIQAKELSEEEAKHYASESKGEDPDAIKGPQKSVMMLASGVDIEGLQPPGGKAPMSTPEKGSAEPGSGSSR